MLWKIVLVLLFVIIGVVIYVLGVLKRARLAGGNEHPAGGKIDLVDINASHYEDLVALTGELETMKWVGDGQPWDIRKVKRFLDYNREEQKQKPNERENFYWGIESDGRLVGVVGFHHVNYGQPETDKLFFLSHFIRADSTGKGLGKSSLRAALSKFWELRDDPIYSDILLDNHRSLAVTRAIGFKPVKIVKINKKKYQRSKITQFGG